MGHQYGSSVCCANRDIILEHMGDFTWSWFGMWFSLGRSRGLSPPCILHALGSLHNWLLICISGWMHWCRNVRWDYSLIVEVLSDAGIYPIGGYISQRHISVAQYITTRPIFDLVVTEKRRVRFPDTIILQEQEGIWFINEGRGACKS